MKFYQSFHHRRLHLFDFPMGGYDHRALPWIQRRALLEGAHHALSEHAKTRFPLVESFTDKFRERYETWVEAGGEGCVLKRKDSTYETARADGKSDLWHRCKKTCTEDYVLYGIGKTAGGQPAGLWGLHKEGKLRKVMQKGCPNALLVSSNIGKLVCEFMGWERFDSGALRHAQFVRVRIDKSPAMCVHEE
jgi:ATP-dependent DNA ligase